MSGYNLNINLFIYTRYAAPNPEGNVASGRAEATSSCSQKNSRCEFFCEQEKSVPCCRRRVGPLPGANAQFADLPRNSCHL